MALDSFVLLGSWYWKCIVTLHNVDAYDNSNNNNRTFKKNAAQSSSQQSLHKANASHKINIKAKQKKKNYDSKRKAFRTNKQKKTVYLLTVIL